MTCRTTGMALVLITACNARSTSTHASDPGRAAGPETAWRALSWEERHDVMTFAVLPNMARLFQRFRAGAPDLTCRTCHGQDAEQVAYRMPHGLPPLDASRMPNPKSHDVIEAKMATFMTDEVTPAMAALVGAARSEPGQKERFSCFNCHPAR